VTTRLASHGIHGSAAPFGSHRAFPSAPKRNRLAVGESFNGDLQAQIQRQILRSLILDQHAIFIEDPVVALRLSSMNLRGDSASPLSTKTYF
jgi:hypothetical protein